MSNLLLCLLGPFSASLEDKPLTRFRTTKVQALLIYLAVESGHAHSREGLMALLWPEMPLASAQINLRQTLYRLKQAVPEVGSEESGTLVPLVLSDRQTIQLNPQASVTLDVTEFSSLIETDPSAAADLYRGDFLMDFYLPDSAAFESWAERHREGLRRQMLGALKDLAAAHLQRGECLEAQEYAWRQLELDELREGAMQQLMTALAGSGQRNAALSQYQLFKKRLGEELAVEPAVETTSLYEKIQNDALDLVQKPRARPATEAGEMPVFIFTDIEGSTPLWNTYRQAMLPALLQHNAVLEEQISVHGGRILELRGDGVKGVFEGVNPLPCVLAIQREFGRADWGEVGEVKIRIGLHGVAQVRKGYDFFTEADTYYGPVLHQAHRVMEVGWGGQILVSEQVHNAYALPPDASWRDFGPQQLKGLAAPVHIYGLLHPDLPHQQFPPLRTTTTPTEPARPREELPRHNLAPQPTPFIGREHELGALDDLLADPEVRLVTLVGPGGMGKTRLAQETAERQLVRTSPDGGSRADGKGALFPDGVYFVSLAPLGDADQITSTIINELKVPIEGEGRSETLERSTRVTRTQQDQLQDYLQMKRMLIVLDNFEHLLDGVDQVIEILRAAPQVQILVTTRERLHVREEQLFPIAGLTFPDWEAPETVEGYTAMVLFLQSARRVEPDFSLRTEDYVDLTRICQLVGGMPLGLELAASWVEMLSLKDIVDELQRGIDFLETDLLDVPERHRSMRAVFDSSWAQLSAPEQTIFPQFAIFRGGFTREAAQAVTGASLRIMARLVSKSLVQFNRATDRYQLHELLRQYGMEKLKKIPKEEEGARDRHSAFYCNELERSLKLTRAGQMQNGLAVVETDIGNIQAAWDRAVKEQDVGRIERGIEGLCWFYEWYWRTQEGWDLCQQVVDQLTALRDAQIAEEAIQAVVRIDRILIQAYTWQGLFSFSLKGIDEVTRYMEKGLAQLKNLEARGVDVSREKTSAYFFQGIFSIIKNEREAAWEFFLEGLELARAIGDQWWELMFLDELGDLARFSGDHIQAKEWIEKYLAAARKQKNRWEETNALNSLGWIARILVSYEEARRLFESSLVLAEEQENIWGVIRATESLGYLALFLGDLEAAAVRLKKCISLNEEIGVPEQAVAVLTNLGVTNWLAGDFDQAEYHICQAISKTQDYGQGWMVIWPMLCYAEYYALTGRYAEAADLMQRVDLLGQDSYVGNWEGGRITRTHGWVAMGQGDFTRAHEQFSESVRLFQEMGDDEQVAWSQAGLGRAEVGIGDLAGARDTLTDALWRSIETQAFIPLIFTLPMTAFLVAADDPEQGVAIYREALRFPFVAKSKMFFDLVGRHLEGLEAIEVESEDRQLPDPRPALFASAGSVLTNWVQAWLED